jgi:hypothetical protein
MKYVDIAAPSKKSLLPLKSYPFTAVQDAKLFPMPLLKQTTLPRTDSIQYKIGQANVKAAHF